jgi:hypothetical protein
MAGALAAYAETEEHLQKSFAVGSGGKLVLDVHVGSIEITASDRKDVSIDLFRKAAIRGFDDQEREGAELKKHEVTFSQAANAVIVRSLRPQDANNKVNLQARYVIAVPRQFDADVKTRGGSIKVSDLAGTLKANTSGGSLKFSGIHGPIDGGTSGGSIDLANSDGKASVKTSGGSIRIQKHKGDVLAKTSGGSISVDEIDGQIQAATSGGSVSAALLKPTGECHLETSGGGITVAVPATAALDIDAKTSGGSVKSDLPVASAAAASPRDKARSRASLKGTLNGGGTPLLLRTSGGSIHLKKL